MPGMQIGACGRVRRLRSAVFYRNRTISIIYNWYTVLYLNIWRGTPPPRGKGFGQPLSPLLRWKKRVWYGTGQKKVQYSLCFSLYYTINTLKSCLQSLSFSTPRALFGYFFLSLSTMTGTEYNGENYLKTLLVVRCSARQFSGRKTSKGLSSTSGICDRGVVFLSNRFPTRWRSISRANCARGQIAASGVFAIGMIWKQWTTVLHFLVITVVDSSHYDYVDYDYLVRQESPSAFRSAFLGISLRMSLPWEVGTRKAFTYVLFSKPCRCFSSSFKVL